MSGLIERQAAIDLIQHAGKIGKLTCIDILKDLPDADAVEVVRCKDCKHRYHSVECPCQNYDHFYSWMPADDWFCKKGERKEK